MRSPGTGLETLGETSRKGSGGREKVLFLGLVKENNDFYVGLVKDKTFCFRVFRRKERFVFGDVQGPSVLFSVLVSYQTAGQVLLNLFRQQYG